VTVRRQRLSRHYGIGLVVEVLTEPGPRYVQWCLTHPDWGHLLRVLPAAGQVHDVCELAARAEDWFAYVDVDDLLESPDVRALSVCEVPVASKSHPLMRSGMPLVRGRGIDESDSWFWDVVREWWVGQLSPAQRNLSLREALPASFFVDRLRWGWTPATNDDYLAAKAEEQDREREP
jgi:hypothetical protein